MNVTILAVGRAKAGPLRELFDQYTKRLNFPVTVREVEARGKLPPAQLRKREGDLLLAALPAQAKAIVLDEAGKALSSADFTSLLGDWRDMGVRDFVFVIGGAEGIAAELHQKADLLLSLGPMTWPHQLARVMLAEQLYRAQSIWSGHPYHRG